MRFLPVALFLISTAMCAADNPFLGTWKLNTAKSKSSPVPVAQSMTVKFDADGEKVRRTVTGVDGEGKPIMQGGPEGSSIAWDGKDHTIENGPPMTVAVKRVNDYRNDVIVKQNGKVITNVRSVVSKDGKTMNMTVKRLDAQGKPSSSNLTFDKQ